MSDETAAPATAPDQSILPALVLPSIPLLPGLMAPLVAEDAAGIAALEAAAAQHEPLALFCERNRTEGSGASEEAGAPGPSVRFPESEANPTEGKRASEEAGAPGGRPSEEAGAPPPSVGGDIDRAATIGVSARIGRLVRLPTGQIQVVLQGVARVRRLEVTAREPYVRVLVQQITPPEASVAGNPLREAVLNSLRAVTALSPGAPEQALLFAANTDDAGQLADIGAGIVDLEVVDRQRVLDTIDPLERLRLVLQLSERRRSYLEVSQRIQREVGEQAGRQQREYLLREQLRAIQRELGELDPQQGAVAELRRQAGEKGLPPQVQTEVMRELSRLESVNPASPEYAVIRTRLDWIMALPWADPPPDDIDLTLAREVLDADHFGLEKVKDRILDYLAVAKLRGGVRGPILCLVGPPGVGKTSLGQSIARALGRPFVRASLGGVRDEAEIRGHRRTYVGALPGRVVQAMRTAGARNPVFMLDEVDKLNVGFQGDPAAALLEVLDPAQNSTFVDNYLDLPYDLSHVFFICTANVLDTIPAPLLDRMELIEIPGYTDHEKVEIARRHLLPRLMGEHGLPDGSLVIDDGMLLALIRGWTREAGVRQLERALAAVCRKAARRRVSGDETVLDVTEAVLEEALGPQRLDETRLEEETSIGAATGLAWTPVGGDLLTIEASVVPGSGQLTLTGQLGEVMQESARAAITYARGRSDRFGLPPEFFQHHDIHIHVPAGAIPKDGPSAGVALVTALVSAATRRPVDRTWAMTGEITLRGLVLPIGGVKEKALAAHRAGLTGLFLPRRNQRDVSEVPEEARQALQWRFVDHVDQVLEAVLLSPVGTPA